MAAEQKPSDPYDELPYPEYCFKETHPDRLAGIGNLFGMTCAPIEKARVLELGAASGGNLIPMAVELPQAKFVGVDLSVPQVKRGNETIAALSLKNIKLEARDILDIPEKLGKFDYIICHGVFSWVPDSVRAKILALCDKLLTPHGVAYISFNTLPGWNMHKSLRDLMLFHTTQFPDAKTKVAQARAMLQFMASSVPEAGNPMGVLLTKELHRLKDLPDSYLFHDYLEENNRAFYFHEFASMAEQNNLKYLGDADVSRMWSSEFSPQIQKTLAALSQGGIVRMEQYLDFVRNQTFRKTLLCKKGIELKRKLTRDNLSGLWFGCGIRILNANANLFTEEAEKCKAATGEEFDISSSLAKVTISCMRNEWPGWISFADLVSRVTGEYTRAGKTAPQIEEAVGTFLLSLLRQNGIEIHAGAPPFSKQVSATPEVSAYARLQISQKITPVSLRHETCGLSEFQSLVASRLNGKTKITTVATEIFRLIEEGKLQMRRAETAGPPSEEKVLQAVQRIVSELAALGFVHG